MSSKSTPSRPPKGSPCIGYIRYSSAKQHENDSIRRQTKNIKKYIRKNKLVLFDKETPKKGRVRNIWEDKGVSGWTGKNNKTINKILELRKLGVYPEGIVLIIESFDRLSRQEVQSVLTRWLNLMEAGISIVTTSDGNRYYPHTGVDTIHLIMGIFTISRAYEESSRKSELIGDKRKQRVLDARRSKDDPDKRLVTSTVPAWYRIVDKTTDEVVDKRNIKPKNKCAVIDEERGAVVRRIIDHYIKDGWGSAKIATTLTKEGVKTFNQSKKETSGIWQGGYISSMMRNIALMGHHQPTHVVDGKRINDGEVIKDYYSESLIDEDEFYQLQNAIETNKKFNNGVRIDKEQINIFRSLVKCSCGINMHHSRSNNGKKVYHYLSCRAKCGQRSVDYDALEFEVLSYIPSASLTDVNTENRLIKNQNEILQGQIATIDSSISKVEKTLDELDEKVVRTDEDEENEDFCLSRRKKLVRKKKELESQILPLIYQGDDHLTNYLDASNSPSRDSDEYDDWAKAQRHRLVDQVDYIEIRMMPLRRGKCNVAKLLMKDGNVKFFDLDESVNMDWSSTTWEDFEKERKETFAYFNKEYRENLREDGVKGTIHNKY